MRYAKPVDWLLLSAGLLLAAVAGGVGPLAALALRGMADTLSRGQAELERGNFSAPVFSRQVMKHVRAYAELGVANLVVGFLCVSSYVIRSCSIFQTSCFFALCERQLHQYRKRFLASVLNQDPAWLDKNPVGTLTAKMSSYVRSAFFC